MCRVYNIIRIKLNIKKIFDTFFANNFVHRIYVSLHILIYKKIIDCRFKNLDAFFAVHNS